MKTSETNTASIMVAREFGRIAYHKGLKAPAQDKNLMGMLWSGMDHKFLIDLMKAWSVGWHSENLNQEVK